MLIRMSALNSDAYWTVHKRGEDVIKVAEEACLVSAVALLFPLTISVSPTGGQSFVLPFE